MSMQIKKILQHFRFRCKHIPNENSKKRFNIFFKIDVRINYFGPLFIPEIKYKDKRVPVFA